jgi:hypothetical protein
MVPADEAVCSVQICCSSVEIKLTSSFDTSGTSTPAIPCRRAAPPATGHHRDLVPVNARNEVASVEVGQEQRLVRRAHE